MPTYFADEKGRYTPERTESRASLVILSDVLDPDEITRRIGMVPDESWVKGTRVTERRIQKHHQWEVRSQTLDDRPAEEVLTELLERLQPVAARIQELARDPDVLSVICRLVRHGDNWNPALGFTPEMVASLHAIGIGLDVDIYVYDPDEWDKSLPSASPHEPLRH